MAPHPTSKKLALPVARVATQGANPSTNLTKLNVCGITLGMDALLEKICGDSVAEALMKSFARAMVDEKENPGTVPWDEVRVFFAQTLPCVIQQFKDPGARIKRTKPIQVAAFEKGQPVLFEALDIIEDCVIAQRQFKAKCVAASLLRALTSPFELPSIEPGTPARVISDHILTLCSEDAVTAAEAIRFLEEIVRERVPKLTDVQPAD